MTVSEIALELKISIDAVRKRIETAGIQPITREALYDPSIVDQLRNIRMGRPKKAAAEPDTPLEAPQAEPDTTPQPKRKSRNKPE